MSLKGVLFNLKYDFPASIVVFLVALPLCLGIALASDAPLFSGILTGVIAGILVGALSGSSVSVSGPAAGLTVLVASGIHKLGGFEAFLLAVTLSGVFQIIFSIMRAGFLASLFPNAVIKGMLAAIGITIIMKQVPHAFGGFGQFEDELRSWDFFGRNTSYRVLWNAITSLNFSAFLICGISLGILTLWDTKLVKTQKYLSKIPGPLVAVTLAAAVNLIFHLNFPSLALRAEDGHLVSLPEIGSWDEFSAQLRHPDFSHIGNSAVWIVAITLAAVGSIETLLSIESTDKLDPFRRVSNTNKELLAQGIGNCVSGMVGGIPMTSVIVRSSANIYAGARTRMSPILHGVILLLSAIALSGTLNLIPLASLAAILLAVGYKLAHPKLFKQMMKEGYDQLIPFVITIVAILLTDLLKGVVIGLLVGLGFVVKAQFYSAILVVRSGQNFLVRFTKDVTFVHKIRLRKELAAIPQNAHVIIDGSRAMFIDHDALEMVQTFVATAPDRGISVELKDVGPRRQVDFSKVNQETSEDGNTSKTFARQSSVGT